MLSLVLSWPNILVPLSRNQFSFDRTSGVVPRSAGRGDRGVDPRTALGAADPTVGRGKGSVGTGYLLPMGVAKLSRRCLSERLPSCLLSPWLQSVIGSDGNRQSKSRVRPREDRRGGDRGDRAELRGRRRKARSAGGGFAKVPRSDANQGASCAKVLGRRERWDSIRGSVAGTGMSRAMGSTARSVCYTPSWPLH